MWDSIRAIDFITSLVNENTGKPLVDPTKIGVTGASGGGSQSLYIAAVDDRIAAEAPVVMISAGFTGDDHCEDGMPIHTVHGQKKTNNTEIAGHVCSKTSSCYF